jgi:hypothetical protein
LSTPIVKVSGKVLDIPAGAKEVSVHVGYDPTSGSSTFISPSVAKDGSFGVWGLDPDKYTLWAETGGKGGLQSGAIELELGTTNIDHVELRLVPPFDISGHVEFEDDQARGASKIVPESSLGPMIKEHSAHLWDELRSQSTQAEIGDDDSFKFEKVQPGRYHAEVTLGHTYVKSLSLGSVESGDGTLDVRNGSGGVPLTLLVSADWGEIGGTVSDSDGPVAGAIVMRFQDRISVVVTADANGRYTMRDIRPGTYKLLAADERVKDLWRDDSELEDYENGMVTVKLHAGDKITQDLKLTPVSKL